MSWFRRPREVLLMEHPDGSWHAHMGSEGGDVTMAQGATREAALEALRIRVQNADVSRPQKVKVNW